MTLIPDWVRLPKRNFIDKMKRFISFIVMAVVYLSTAIAAMADTHCRIVSPDGSTNVYIITLDGKAYYNVEHHGNTFVSTSRLGMSTNIGDFSALEYVSVDQEIVDGSYELKTVKASEISYKANKAVCTFRNPAGQALKVEFRVGDNDVAFRYILPKEGETGSARILDELTEFAFNDDADNTYLKTYLTPQSHAMIGWKRTKPSYEEYYGIGKPATAPSGYGHGYTFPCLFQLGEDGWVLVSETGVDSRYCGSRLGEYRDLGDNILLSGVTDKVHESLVKFGVDLEIGQEHIFPHIVPALAKAKEIAESK